MIHNKIASHRKLIQPGYTDGHIKIVTKEQKVDEFNTPLPNQVTEQIIGKYAFRTVAIHSNDIYEFQDRQIELKTQVRIPFVFGLHTGMTGVIAGNYYNIVKVFSDFAKQEVELLLAEERV